MKPYANGSLSILAATAVALLVAVAHAADIPVTSGPAPYPTHAADWPGTGVIRVFDWMAEQRRTFWSRRALDRGAIVFAGDSLTANWRTLQAAFPDMPVANRGIGGDVSRGLLFRFDEDVLDLLPRAIVILIGTNDLTARQQASATLANIGAMLDRARARQPDTPILLCTVPASDHPQAPVEAAQREALNSGLTALAARHVHVTLVDLFAATATTDRMPDPRYFTPDRLHLSEAGYARWHLALLPALRAAGALPP